MKQDEREVEDFSTRTEKHIMFYLNLCSQHWGLRVLMTTKSR